MLLFWKIRYLDSQDREFKDRDLWLETATLEPATKAAVEVIHDLRDSGPGREILRYLSRKRGGVTVSGSRRYQTPLL